MLKEPEEVSRPGRLSSEQILAFIARPCPLLSAPARASSLCYICHAYRNHTTFIKGISVIFQIVSNQKRSLQLIKVSSWRQR